MAEVVTQSDISEFRSLYKSKFGIELEDFEARSKLELLVRQMELVYQPITAKEVLTINVNEYSNEQSKPKPAAN